MGKLHGFDTEHTQKFTIERDRVTKNGSNLTNHKLTVPVAILSHLYRLTPAYALNLHTACRRCCGRGLCWMLLLHHHKQISSRDLSLNLQNTPSCCRQLRHNICTAANGQPLQCGLVSCSQLATSAVCIDFHTASITVILMVTL